MADLRAFFQGPAKICKKIVFHTGTSGENVFHAETSAVAKIKIAVELSIL